jgi:hypothetical protein
MAQIPIDTTGCYVKYTFPNDLPLKSTGYQYQGIDPMMQAATGTNLIQKTNVFIERQAYSSDPSKGNYIIFKGCIKEHGSGMQPRIKVSGITTPAS